LISASLHPAAADFLARFTCSFNHFIKFT